MHSIRIRVVRCGGLVLLWSFAFWQTAQAQQGLPGSSNVPDLRYYAIFRDYYQGNIRDAAREFASTSGAIRFGEQRYLDSSCYWTMSGECQFHAGNYSNAIELYETALGLYLDFAASGWHERIQTPPLINARNGAVQSAQITWGQSTRTGTVAGLPDSMQVLFGRLDNERVAQQGGVIQNPEFRQVDVGEIMRCMAIGLHRRRWIKGVTCKYDAFSTRLAEVLGGLGRPDGSVLGAWNGVLAGLASAGVEEFDTAQRLLLQSLQFGGGMDHPLTPIALLELGIINLQLNDLPKAAQYALEASYSAAIFNQYDVLEEALALGTTIHLMQNRSEYPPLLPAIVWASRNRARLLQTSLTARLAECYSEAGNSSASAQLLGDAAKGVRGLAPAGGPLAGRIGYLAALNQFLDGNYDDGRESLGEALQHFQAGSRWLYQLSLADSLTIKKQITDRQSIVLYQLLLRDPADSEWQMEPIEAMSFLASDHLEPIERWFEISVASKDYEQAIEVAELLKRHRFYSSLPLVGRELAFRWLMHGPLETIGPDVMAQRTDFIARFPQYKQYSDRADRLQQVLMTTPLQTEPDTDERKAQVDNFVELMKVSQLQEAALASFALRREPARMTFPPPIVASSIRNDIPTDQVILYTVATSNAIYFFSVDVSGAKLLAWQTPKKVASDINQIFRESNLSERQLDEDMLKDEKWRVLAHKVAEAWFPALDLSGLNESSEIVIIPDGILWYAPFEMLQIGAAAEQSKSLFELAAIRYSPTLGLAVTKQRAYKPWTRTAVFSGPLDKKFENEWTQARVQDYQKQSPTIVNFDERLEIPSGLYNTIIDQVVVWTESIRPQRGGAYALTPVEKDGKTGSNLASWLSLPFDGAEHVVLPCFSGDGETGVKGRVDGHEYFITACSLFASGTRTLLISRWNVGGDSTLEVSRKYLDNLAADMSPVSAWHSAAHALTQTKLDWSKETRLKPAKTPPEVTGAHPLFWSSYMLMDVPTTRVPEAPAKEAEIQIDGQPNAGDAPKLPGEAPKEMIPKNKDSGPGDPAKQKKPLDNPPKKDDESQNDNDKIAVDKTR
jgi:tetratricopeptide (TPR) repeat protein